MNLWTMTVTSRNLVNNRIKDITVNFYSPAETISEFLEQITALGFACMRRNADGVPVANHGLTVRAMWLHLEPALRSEEIEALAEAA